MAVIKNLIDTWSKTYSARRVFGDPIEKEGIVIIPVAMVGGGGGGGSAPAEGPDAPENEGGGFGGMARPVGAYVVREDGLEWHPAIDVTMLGMAGIALAALITLVLGRALRRRR